MGVEYENRPKRARSSTQMTEFVYVSESITPRGSKSVKGLLFIQDTATPFEVWGGASSGGPGSQRVLLCPEKSLFQCLPGNIAAAEEIVAGDGIDHSVGCLPGFRDGRSAGHAHHHAAT